MKLFMLFGACLLLCFTAPSSAEAEQVTLRGVRGLDAELPCGQGMVYLDGPGSYVTWTKNDKKMLYRYPEENSRTTSTQNLKKVFKMCKTNSCKDPTSLQLKRVGESDGGLYCCRVHYQALPAIDYIIDLKVINSPGTPKIYNSDGFDLSDKMWQLNLGSSTVLYCEVKEDLLGAAVWWKRNGVEVARSESVENGLLRTSVQIFKASRDELNAHYECMAQNADVTDPLTTYVTFKMDLPPISVEIRLNNNLDFEVGQPRVVDCVVVGCVPPPTITWHLGNVMLKPNVHKELHDGNFTVSSLTLAPSLRDDKHELTCRAHNSHLPREVFEDKVILNVGFRPVCLNVQEEMIGYVVGQTETVICMVEAYSEPKQFTWIFADNKKLYTSGKKVPGYQNRYSSSLTWKPQHSDEGELLCRATNVFGEQKQPCVFSIVPGGPPMTPDCAFVKSDPNTIKVSCEKTWDGGRPQTIHLELSKSGNCVQNLTDACGNFVIPKFHERNITAVLYASNSRGRSGIKVLKLPATVNNTNKKGIKETENAKYQLWGGLVIGTIVFGTVIGIIARCLKFFDDRRLGIAKSTEYSEEDTTFTMVSDGSFQRQPDVLPKQYTERRCAHVVINVPSRNKSVPFATYTVENEASTARAKDDPHRFYPISQVKAAKELGISIGPKAIQDQYTKPRNERVSYFV